MLSSSFSHEELDLVRRSLRDVTTREWIIVFVLCSSNVLINMGKFCAAAILHDLQIYFSIKNDKGGLLLTASSLLFTVLSPAFGYLGDRYNRKNILLFSYLFWNASVLTSSFMTTYWPFLLCRPLGGVGEACNSIVTPTIIGDSFTSRARSSVLAIYYLAIPIGCGLGYTLGAEVTRFTRSWQWSLRVLPILGVLVLFLIVILTTDPPRGASDGDSTLTPTSWKKDLKVLLQNRTYMAATAAEICICFAVGALWWWTPKFLYVGLTLAGSDGKTSISIYGLFSLVAGLSGVGLGWFLSYKLRSRFSRIDPLICSGGLFVSALFMVGVVFAITHSVVMCYGLLFLTVTTLNVNWSITTDIVFGVVLPTRRSTAQAFQMLTSHFLGDVGSPYFFGLLSEALIEAMRRKDEWKKHEMIGFEALQYSVLATLTVQILGSVFYLIVFRVILDDRDNVKKEMNELNRQEISL